MASGRGTVRWVRQEVVEPEVRPLADLAAERGIRPLPLDPLITVRREAWDALHRHVGGSGVEVGGILVGRVFADPRDGRLLVDVEAALPALGAHGTGTYFRFTPEAWDAISRAREALHPDRITVGWYHSHPALGVFYSGTDRASQAAFFDRPWSVGVVVDPVQGQHGIFVGPESLRVPKQHLVVYDDAVTMPEATGGPGPGEAVGIVALPPTGSDGAGVAAPVLFPPVRPSRDPGRWWWVPGALAAAGVGVVAGAAWAARRKQRA